MVFAVHSLCSSGLVRDYQTGVEVTESSHRLKRSSRAGIAAVSTIALALGGISVVGPGPLAPHAAAATLSGGIRDKSGAVEEDAQKASDLPAGSCVVNSGEPSGSQAGFSWSTLEPGDTSHSKTLWGLSVSFDNSKDRTFADWYFTNTGGLGSVLDTGEVPSMEAGQTFDGKRVTDKADESIKINASGRILRNLNLYAELTDEKVKQFASADSPVRYAWQNNYKVQNPDGPYATKGVSASFGATVNPWPSENIECNPITVSWENWKKHVIVPGEETKIGTVNVPALKNGGTDDSLSRMVVEAYDGNGKFIGTTDPGASDGEQLLRVDENGDVYYTWPMYRDPENADKSTEKQKLAAQQNVSFSVIAQPRSVDQLQAAAEHNNAGEGKAFDSSNSLSRYNTANVIDSRSFSLDDTINHDPQYDKYQETIISGVESTTGPLVTGRQKVTFKQIPDKIADLVKKRADGGYEATVKLNDKYVFDGWDAELDPNTHDVTITAPKNPLPGTFAQARVIVTYANGSKDEIPLLVAVQENDTQTTDVSYPFKRASQNVQMTAEPQLTRILKKNDEPARRPKSYAIRGDWEAPDGWTVSIDQETGVVSAKSAAKVPDNTVLEVPVVATYEDTTTDEVIAKFQVASSVKVPGYDAASGKPGDEVALPAELPKIGLGGNEDDEEPARYTFENGETTFETESVDPNYQWKFTIDETTGDITATIPQGALPGAFYAIPVKAHYGSGAPSQKTTATVIVVGSGDGEDTAHYIAQSTQAGKSVDSKINSQLSDPTLAKYELGTVPEGWTATVAEDGTVTATPNENQKPGTEIEIPVNITYPGGGKGSTTAKFIVVGNDAQNNNPLYPTVTVPRGTTAHSELDTSHLDLDKVKFFHIITDPNEKGYVTPPRNLDLTKVSIDDNGNITTPVSKNALPGSSADIPVKITYQDGSVDYTVATVVVKAQRNQVYEPHYSLKETTPGEGVTSEPLADTAVNKQDLSEQGFTVPEEVDGWKVTVDKETGAVTATPPASARAGDKTEVPVTVNYEDGSTDTVLAPFVVREKQNEIHEPSYSVESTKPGEGVEHAIKNVPDGAKFDVPAEQDGWKYSVDDDGNVTATAPQNAKPGDKKTTNVTVTYSDGSTDTVPVTTVVSLTNNYEAEPFYPAEKSYPGETATSPLNMSKAEGIDLANKNPFAIIVKDGFTPTGQNNSAGNPIYTVSTANGAWLISLDEDGNVKADIPVTAQPGDSVQVPVRLTYSDGSTDTTTAPITVVDNPTRPIPFKVEYQYDASMPAGKSKVVTQGEAGSEKQLRDGTWETTKSAVNEVVKIGIKPAENSEDVTWTVPIPYSTETRPNPALAPGETKVVQEGVDGERTFTAKFRSVGDESYVVDAEDNKQPVKEIIEYGPRLDDQELKTETERKIPFETTIVADPTLEAGTQVVDTQGVVGEEKVTSTLKLVDGKPSGDPVVETTTVTEKQDAVIRVGTKTEGDVVSTATVEIPAPVEVEYDPKLNAGETVVVAEGEPGEKTVTITRKVVNSEAQDEQQVTEDVTKEPKPRKIKVGIKPGEATQNVTWKVPVPFETELVPNRELAAGETRVKQQGELGEKELTAVLRAVGNESYSVANEKVTKEPVKEIIEYGPRLGENQIVTVNTHEIPFETKIVFDDTLAAGEQVVDTQGVAGVEQITTTQKLVDGEVSGAPAVAKQILTPKQDAVIRVGTKTEGANTVEHTEPVPFETEIVLDPKLPAGEHKVETEGKPGEKTVKVTQTIVNSEVTETNREEKVTVEPVTQVIKVGVQPAENTEDVKWTVPVPYSTTTRPNPDLAPGETKVVQEGVNGERTFTAKFRSVGDESYVVESEDTKDAVEEIIEYGPRLEDDVLVTETSNVIPFETKIVPDDTLSAGTQEIETQGFLGYERVTSTQKLVDGKPSGDPVVTTERTKDPVNAVIRVGTKTEGETVNTYDAEIPFPVRVEYDPKMPAGKAEVKQEGKPGKKTVTVTQPVVNSQPSGEATTTEQIVEKPVEQVITVGIKPAETSKPVSWTAQIPFETVVRPNPALKPGEVKTVQDGEYGEKKFTAHFRAVGGESYVVPDEEITKQPKQQIIEYGPTIEDQTLTSTTTRPIQFKTKIIFDANLPAGEQTVTQGENGEETVTSIQEIKDGKPVGEPKITTEQTKAPKDAEIRIGTKKPEAPAPTPETPVSQVVELPFTTRIVHDPTLKPGQEVEDVAGVNGEVKVTVVNGKASVETVREPVQRVVRVGTKPADGVEWTEQIPFKVEVKKNPKLKAGEYKVLQEGKPGLTQHTSDGQSEIISEPVPHVIEIGVLEQIAANVMVGEKVVVPIAGHKPGNRYTIDEAAKSLPKGWNAVLNQATGQLTVTTPPDAKPGDEAEIAVDVVDSEGNERRVIAKVLAAKADAEVEQPTTPAPEPEDGSSAKAKQTAERCFGNAVRSPILWLLPIGILGAVGGKVLEPHMAAINQQFGEFNAEINRRVQQSMPDFGFGGQRSNNEQINQLMAQVDAANRQLQALAGDPNVQMIGKVIGAVAALAAISGVLYDWCSAEVGQAKTAIDFGEGSSSRR